MSPEADGKSSSGSGVSGAPDQHGLALLAFSKTYDVSADHVCPVRSDLLRS
jgi:hypothetical protein